MHSRISAVASSIRSSRTSKTRLSCTVRIGRISSLPFSAFTRFAMESFRQSAPSPCTGVLIAIRSAEFFFPRSRLRISGRYRLRPSAVSTYKASFALRFVVLCQLASPLYLSRMPLMYSLHSSVLTVTPAFVWRFRDSPGPPMPYMMPNIVPLATVLRCLYSGRLLSLASASGILNTAAVVMAWTSSPFR